MSKRERAIAQAKQQSANQQLANQQLANQQLANQSVYLPVNQPNQHVNIPTNQLPTTSQTVNQPFTQQPTSNQTVAHPDNSVTQPFTQQHTGNQTVNQPFTQQPASNQTVAHPDNSQLTVNQPFTQQPTSNQTVVHPDNSMLTGNQQHNTSTQSVNPQNIQQHRVHNYYTKQNQQTKKYTHKKQDGLTAEQLSTMTKQQKDVYFAERTATNMQILYAKKEKTLQKIKLNMESIDNQIGLAELKKLIALGQVNVRASVIIGLDGNRIDLYAKRQPIGDIESDSSDESESDEYDEQFAVAFNVNDHSDDNIADVGVIGMIGSTM